MRLYGRTRTGSGRPIGAIQILNALHSGDAYPGVTRNVRAPMAATARVAKLTTVSPRSMYDVAVVVNKTLTAPLSDLPPTIDKTSDVALTFWRDNEVTHPAVLECVQPAHMVVDATPHHADGYHRWQVINPPPHAIVLKKGWTMGLAALTCASERQDAPNPTPPTKEDVARRMEALAAQLERERRSGAAEYVSKVRGGGGCRQRRSRWTSRGRPR